MSTLPWLLLVAAGLAVDKTPAEVRRPNVLFIAVDDLNDWIGCAGPPIFVPSVF